MRNFEKVVTFREKILKKPVPTRGITKMTENCKKEAITAIEKHLEGLKDGCTSNDMEKVGESLTKVVYDSMNTLAEIGFPYIHAFDELHEENMKKKDGKLPKKTKPTDFGKHFK